MDSLGEARLAGLPPHMQALGVVNGIPVVESAALGYDEMYISSYDAKIVVGEIAHFRYRIRQLEANERCRRTARQQIEAMAADILGESWKAGGGV